MEHHQAREENTKIHLAVPAAPPKPQHKCPRCNSTNTKFCYFNNYSLSQPRHFCKTCKRYWTQGGTFRNIPVGGASRKAKRGKTDSSPSNSLTQPHSDLVNPSPSLTMAHSTTPYYQLGGGGGGGGGGGYLSSLATLHSLTPSQPFNHYLNVAGSSSILPLLSGFNAAAAASFPPRFHHVGIRERMESLYPAPQRLLPSNVSGGSAAAAAQSLISDVSSTNLTAGSDVSFWSATINATSISGNSDRNNVKGGSSSSLIPNHWLHPPGYRPPQ